MNRTTLQLALAGAAISLSLPAFAQTKKDVIIDPERGRITEVTEVERSGKLVKSERLELKRVSDVLKMNVHTSDDKLAGEISNLAIDPDNGRVVFVIVKPPAKSQVGEDMKIVPFEALKFDDTKVELNVNAERFKNAPPFDPAGWGKPGDGRWSQIVFRHYGVEPREIEVLKLEKGDVETLAKATDLLRMHIHNEAGQALGDIDDLAMDTKHGVIVYAIMSSTFKPDGPEKFVAVPWMAIESTPEMRVLVLDLERDRLREAPTFTTFQSLASRSFADKVIAFYGTDRDVIYGFIPADETPARTLDLGGWEHQGAYGRLFDAGSIETVQGKVVELQRFTPMPGMGEGVRLQLDAATNRNTSVQLGPAWFIDRQTLPFNVGDEVTVVGSRTEMEGRAAFMAIEIRRGDDIVYLRDRQGVPRWDATYRMRDIAPPAGRPARERGRDDLQ